MLKIGTGYAFTISDIFYNFNRERISTSVKERLKVVHGETDKMFFICRIFRTAIELVIKDIVENSSTFWLPLGGTKIRACIKMDRLVDKDFVVFRKLGTLPNLDIFETMFSMPVMRFHMMGFTTDRCKSMILPKVLQERITEKANAGFLYGDTIRDTTYKDYLEKLYELFPNVVRTDIIKIVKFGWKSVYRNCSLGGDIKMFQNKLLYYIGTIYRNPLRLFTSYLHKLKIKLRVIFKRKGLKWDGFYYFGIRKKEYDEYLKTKVFKNIHPYRLYEECDLSNTGESYIFKIKLPGEVKYKTFRETFDGECELILHRPSLKFRDILTSNKKYEILNTKISYAERKRNQYIQ